MERGLRALLFLAIIFLGLTANAQKYRIISDATWKATSNPGANWMDVWYNDAAWGTSSLNTGTSILPIIPGTMDMWYYPYSDSVYFRKEFELKSNCFESGFNGGQFAQIAVDDEFEVYVNGALALKGKGFGQFAMNPFLRVGKNVIAILAVNGACSGVCPYTMSFGVEIDYISGPEIQMDPDKFVCEGDSVFFGPIDHYQSYLWNTGANTRSIKVGKAGKYWLTAKDTALCDWIDTVELVTYNHADVNIGPDQVICTGEVAKFDAGAGYTTYAWSTGDTTDTLVVNYQGVFSVTVTDANGCSSADTAEVQSFENASVELGPDTSLCKGDSLVLTAFFPYSTYRWDDGSIDSFRIVKQPGNYAVTITNNCGTVNDDINIDYINDISVDLGPDAFFCFSQDFELVAEVFGASKYEWSTGDTTYKIVVEEPGDYWVRVEDKCGNEGYDDKEIIHGLVEEAMIPNSFTPNNDALNETWRPYITTYGEYLVQVIDPWGKVVFESEDPEEAWDGKNEGEPVANGNYIYKIKFVDCEFQTEIFTGVVNVVR